MPRKPKVRWHDGNNCWVSDVGERYEDKSGRWRRRTVSFPDILKKDEREARRALEAYLDREDARRQDARNPTVRMVCELYLEWLESNREESTYTANKGLLTRFVRFPPHGNREPFGSRRVSAMQPEDLEFLLETMSKSHKPSYCAVMHEAVQAAFNWAARRIKDREPDVLIASNPFKGVPKPYVPPAPEQYMERRELAAFLRWAWRHAGRRGSRDRPSIANNFDKQLCLLIRLAAHTGARPGELCIPGKVKDRKDGKGFTWEHWNPDAGANRFGHRIGLILLPKHKTSGKTGRPREIVVPPKLVRAIERHRAHEWTHPKWVFTHRRGVGAEKRGANTAAIGEPWTSHALGIKIKDWRREAIAAGVPLKDEGDNRFRLYRIRHTRITDLVMGGLSHEQAAALTGTSGRMIAKTYAHLTGSRLIDLDSESRSKGKDKG